MVEVVLDVRHAARGPGRYGQVLLEGLRELPDAPAVLALRRGRTALGAAATAPFTPWGRAGVGWAARRCRAAVVHWSHVESSRVEAATVVTIPDLLPLTFPGTMPSAGRRAVYRRLVTASLRRAARVIVPSPQTREAVLDLGAAGEVVVIPLAASGRFRPATEDERGRARERFGGGGPYVAAVPGGKAHKNLDGLAAAARVVRTAVDVTFACCGRPPTRWRSGAGALAGLRFTGRLPDSDLRLLYGGASLLVVPSHIEGFGLPAVEGAACGLPVVCGPRLGALPYLGAGSIVTDVARPGALAAAIIRLLEDDAERRTMGAAARAAASALAPRAMAAATAVVYRDAAAGR